MTNLSTPNGLTPAEWEELCDLTENVDDLDEDDFARMSDLGWKISDASN